MRTLCLVFSGLQLHVLAHGLSPPSISISSSGEMNIGQMPQWLSGMTQCAFFEAVGGPAFYGVLLPSDRIIRHAFFTNDQCSLVATPLMISKRNCPSHLTKYRRTQLGTVLTRTRTRRGQGCFNSAPANAGTRPSPIFRFSKMSPFHSNGTCISSVSLIG